MNKQDNNQQQTEQQQQQKTKQPQQTGDSRNSINEEPVEERSSTVIDQPGEQLRRKNEPETDKPADDPETTDRQVPKMSD